MTDHGLPPGSVQMNVYIDQDYPGLVAGPAATKIGSVWQATQVIAIAGTHRFWYRLVDPNPFIGFKLVYNSTTCCNIWYETPVPTFVTTRDDALVLFEFDEATGFLRATQDPPTDVRARSWGRIKAIYR